MHGGLLPAHRQRHCCKMQRHNLPAAKDPLHYTFSVSASGAVKTPLTIYYFNELRTRQKIMLDAGNFVLRHQYSTAFDFCWNLLDIAYRGGASQRERRYNGRFLPMQSGRHHGYPKKPRCLVIGATRRDVDTCAYRERTRQQPCYQPDIIWWP